MDFVNEALQVGHGGNHLRKEALLMNSKWTKGPPLYRQKSLFLRYLKSLWLIW